MKVLVIRNSALGDVVLMLPVLRTVLNQYPSLEIVVLTRREFAPLFDGIPHLSTVQADFKGKHKGTLGIYQLFKDINNQHSIDAVADMHDVIRSGLLKAMYAARGVKTTTIDKGRKEKKELINGKLKQDLKHTCIRYADVFNRLGFPIQDLNLDYSPSSGNEHLINSLDLNNPGIKHIGIAPISKHALKNWPLSYMQELMNSIESSNKVRFYLFGGKSDESVIGNLLGKSSHHVNLAGKYSLKEELAIMAKLHFMLSMDSANMHLANEAGCKVISIWGATDPVAGFSAFHQPASHYIFIPTSQLSCRPCTIYGKGSCHRKDLACLHQLKPQMVFDRLRSLKLIN